MEQGFNCPEGSRPLISVVIRCRNEAADLRRVFRALDAQQCDFVWEVIVVDNDSTDDTAAVASEHGARVVPISQAAFSYGRALNVGLEAARGELALILSAHALPIGSRFLEAAAKPFADPSIAAVRCLQIGKTNQLLDWYNAKNLEYGSADEQQEAERGIAWVSAYPTAGCCVIRRSVWTEVRYDETLESNEDKLWASKVLARGYRIRSCADAVWLYTRTYARRDWLRREARQQLSLYRLTGRAPMTWARYFALAGRYLVLSPLVAVRYIFQNMAHNTALVSIPWKARRTPAAGSFPEFEPSRRSTVGRPESERRRVSGVASASTP